jgi:hypothetical protein
MILAQTRANQSKTGPAKAIATAGELDIPYVTAVLTFLKCAQHKSIQMIFKLSRF